MRYLFKFSFSLSILILVTLSLLLLEERQIFNVQTLSQTDPLPHTKSLIKKEKYLEAEEYLSYFIQYEYVKKIPESRELLKTIQTKRNSYEYQQSKFIEGFLKGKSDEDIGKATAIASDFLLIGDIRDLSIEGVHYFNDKKVDNVVVALSSLGLLATVSTIYTLGATAPVKTSISVLKYAKSANKLPSWLSKQLIEHAKIAKKTKSLDKIKTLLQPIHQLYKKVGLSQTLNLISSTKNVKELNKLIKFSSRFGKKSPLLMLTTNNKALHYSKLLPNAQSKNIYYASTYGEHGLKAMSKMGEAKFMRRMGTKAHFAKTGYKGNFSPLFNYLLKNLPNWLLFTTAFLGLFYFIKKFYVLAKRLF